MPERIAVVLCNLGGPDSLKSVRPFLFNLFSDPDIFRLPLPFLTQRPFAALIAWRREHEAAKAYAAIGGKSPLLEYTRAQAQALQQALAIAGEYDVHVCMRYWHPLTAEVVAMLKAKNYARIILLPLYPQYSITTVGSSYHEFLRQCQKQHYHPPIKLVQQWHDQPDYQAAILQSLGDEIKKFPDPDPARTVLLFSAHGLPQKVIDQGDPYERQIRATYDALRTSLGWPHTLLCYQSRVGPLAWLRPYTEDAIREKAAAGFKQMLVYPIAFVSDHVETLFELGITYANLARALGINHYRVTPALNNHPRFIEALKSLVLNAMIQA